MSNNDLDPDELGTDWFTRLNAPFFTHSTGLQELDEVLGGGIKPREIISIDGDGGSGKTQLVLTIMSEFLIRNRNEKGYIYYIDFHRGLVPTRLRQIMRARAKDLDEKTVEKLLKKILYVHLNDEDELWDMVRNFSVSFHILLSIEDLTSELLRREKCDNGDHRKHWINSYQNNDLWNPEGNTKEDSLCAGLHWIN